MVTAVIFESRGGVSGNSLFSFPPRFFVDRVGVNNSI